MTPIHWLRPEWVWSAIPLLVALALLARQQRNPRHWAAHFDADLLPHLLDQTGQRKRRLWPFALAATLAWLAMMGPSWQQLPSPTLEDRGGLAIVLDLSPSMLAEDIQPSRLQRAKYAIRDILNLRSDGQTALVASAGDAFVVAPLTDDGNTLSTLLPALHPAMMPVQGSNPLAGLARAQQLLDNAGSPSGHILLIGDGFAATQLKGLEEFVAQSRYPLSILGIGSEKGAPIPLPEGGFLKDQQGNTVVATLPEGLMRSLANKAGGNYLNLNEQTRDSQLRKIAQGSPSLQESEDRRHFEQWQDGGRYLVVLLLPLALLALRRGSLAILLLALFSYPESSYALDWQHPWQTPDQRGYALFDRDPEAAAQQFTDPAWLGSAHYRAGNYSAAAQAFAQDDSADGHYNRGNALAKSGDLDAAIDAYNQALQRRADMADAKANKALIQALKDQQQTGGENKETAQQDGSGQNSGQQNGGQQNSSPQDPVGGESEKASQNDSGEEKKRSADTGQPEPQQDGKDSSGANSNSDSQQNAPEDSSPSAAQQALAKQHAQQPDSEPASKGEPDSTQLSPEQDRNSQGDSAAASLAPLSEEQQAQEQWLRNIPDSSDTLLRNKFQYQFDQRRRQGELPEAENYAPY